MESVIWVQILDEAVYFLFHMNACGKVMNPSLFPALSS